MPEPSALELRLSATATSDGSLREESPRLLRRGAGVRRHARRRAWRWTCTTASGSSCRDMPAQLRRRPGPSRRSAPPSTISSSAPAGRGTSSGTTRRQALRFSDHLRPAAVVYDCMDELSAFKGAASDLPELERRLMTRADLVLTGGQSLYEAKKDRHRNIHAMPSSVDVAHFASARHGAADPPDQRDMPRPRLGFFGVLDERLDIPLLAGLAEAQARLADRDDRPGREDRTRRSASARPTSTTSGRSRTASCRATSPAGTSRCCSSPATRRRASSARPRRRSISPPASRSCRPRFATSSRRTASTGLVRDRRHRARDGAGLRRRR